MNKLKKMAFISVILIGCNANALDLNNMLDKWIDNKSTAKVEKKENPTKSNNYENNSNDWDREQEGWRTLGIYRIEDRKALAIDSLAEAKAWREADIVFNQVVKWKKIGLNTPKQVREWADNNMFADETTEWFSFGIKTPSDVIQLKNAGVSSTDEMQRWHAIGIKVPKEIIAWKNIFGTDYDPNDAERWMEAKVNTPEEAKKWYDGNFKEYEVNEWKEIGVLNPNDAIKWSSISDGRIDFVKEWFSIQITDVAQINKWAKALNYSNNENTNEDNINYVSIDSVKKVNNFYKNKKNTFELYMADQQELTNSGCKIKYFEYLENDIAIEEAKKWCKIPVDLEHISKLHQASISPDEIKQVNSFINPKSMNHNAYEYNLNDLINWKKNGLALSEFDNWNNLKDSGGARNIIEWKQKKIPDNEIKGWISLGINDSSIIDELAPFGIKSYQDTKKWQDVGVQVSYITIFKNWHNMGLNTPEKIKAWSIVAPNILNKDIHKHIEAQQLVYNALKAGYKTPQEYRVVQIAEEKEQTRLDNERAKVKKVCDAWKDKATQKVYSLGRGHQVWSKSNGKVYYIQQAYGNIFEIMIAGVTFEFTKDSFIPYSELQNAPSKYCYQ